MIFLRRGGGGGGGGEYLFEAIHRPGIVDKTVLKTRQQETRLSTALEQRAREKSQPETELQAADRAATGAGVTSELGQRQRGLLYRQTSK